MADVFTPIVRPVFATSGPVPVPLPPMPAPPTPIPTGGGSTDGGIDWGSILSAGINILGKGASYAKDNIKDIALAAMAAQQGLAAAKASARASGFQDKALSLAEQNWAAGAPLRTAGTTGLLTPKVTNLSSVYGDQSNPFSAQVRRVAPPQTPVASPSIVPPPTTPVVPNRRLALVARARRMP